LQFSGEQFVKRYQALDSVRGIALILVLIWHYLPRGSASPGWLIISVSTFWSGVDLFFVLSGFLIGGILLQNSDAQNYFSTFYIRRAARILPLYLLIFTMFVIIICLGPKFLVKTYDMHLPLWSYLSFTQNFFYAARAGFNDPLIDVTWSLAVEEQFYVFLSLVVRKLSKKKLLIATIVLIILAPILRFYAPNYFVAYLLPLHRADSLMSGVLLALIWQWDNGKDFLRKHPAIFRWSFLVFFLGAIVLTYQQTRIGDVIGHFWLAIFYCNFILLVLIQQDGTQGFGVLNNRILEWFGLRSYGIYLFHKPLLILMPIFLTWLLNIVPLPWTAVLINLLVLAILTELSYHGIEKPFMKWGHRFKYR
jgi:peptidoglycan/LPS O-acetylase OafA/YrhL